MNYYLDTRHTGKDGRCPLRLRLTKDGRSAMLLTGIRIDPSSWKDGRTKDARLNLRLRDIFDNAEDCILRLRASGRYDDMTAQEVADELARRVLMQERPIVCRDTFITRMEEYRDRQRKPGTREVYERTIRKLRAYDPLIDTRKFKDIDIKYLERFEDHCLETMKVNSVSILLRNIRTVFGDAREEGITSCNPFARYHIRQEPTRKRCLSVEDLEKLASLDIPEDQERYRDYFFLMIYLIGINLTDLFHAKPEDLNGGRLYYVRDKTGKPYSVKVEPEAMAIIEKYRGKEWLLEALDNHCEFLWWRSQINKRLKALGQVTGKRGKIVKRGPFPGLSTYWSRHTWATIAYEIGIPVDIIGQALGHSDRSHTVTFIYIKPDERKVDEANRKVIDYLMKNAPSLADRSNEYEPNSTDDERISTAKISDFIIKPPAHHCDG